MARGPITQGVIDITRLIGRKIVGRSDPRSGAKLSRAERKGQGAAETARANAEILAGSSVIGGAVLLVVAMFIFEARGGSSGNTPQPIDQLKVTDAAALRAVLWGATPWVIECADTGEGGHSLLREAAAERLLPNGLRAGTIDCERLLPSGDSLLQRFQLKPPPAGEAPLLLQAGHDLAAPVALGRHTSAASLARHLKRWSAPHVPLVNSTLDLRRLCLSAHRPLCLLLLTTGTAHDGTKAALLKAVGSAHRSLGVVTLNQRTHSASFTSRIPQTNRAVLLALRAAPATGPLSAEARAFKGVINAENQLDLEAFVSTAAKEGSAGFSALDTPPRVSPVTVRAASAEDIASEELYDPLLSGKRYERETRL